MSLKICQKEGGGKMERKRKERIKGRNEGGRERKRKGEERKGWGRRREEGGGGKREALRGGIG